MAGDVDALSDKAGIEGEISDSATKKQSLNRLNCLKSGEAAELDSEKKQSNESNTAAASL